MNPFQVEPQQDGGDDPKKKVFCCRICQASLASKSLRTQHELEIHPQQNLPFTCPTCGKGFYLKSHLLSHEKVHSKEKLLKCFQCCFSTKWKSSLERHQIMETHHVNRWQARRKRGNEEFHCQKCLNRQTVRVPNYNLVIMNVRDSDGSMRRIRFQPPTPESRRWLRERRLLGLQRENDLQSLEDYQMVEFNEQFD